MPPEQGFQFQQPFDARAVEPSSFAPPPPMDDYHVRIEGSEVKPTTDQTGGYLELTLEILDPGPYQGRKVPYRLNLYNKSQQTCEIAYRQLSSVCHVVGIYNVTDTRQLHNIPFIATIGPQKDNPQYSNVFIVKDLNGVVPGAKAAAPAAPAAPAQTPPVAATRWGAPAAPAAAPAAPPAAQPWSQPAPAPTAATPWSQPQPATAPAPQAWQPPAAAAPAQAAPAAQPWSPAVPAATPPWQR